jgi:hypothetical protein
VVRAVRVTCCDRWVAAVILDERDLAFQPAEPGADARDREPFRGPLRAGFRTIGYKRRERPLELFVQNPWRRRRADLSRCLLQMLFEGALAGPAPGQSGRSDNAADDFSSVPRGRAPPPPTWPKTRMATDAGEGTRTLTPPKETPDFKSGAYDQFRHPGGAKDSPGVSALRGAAPSPPDFEEYTDRKTDDDEQQRPPAVTSPRDDRRKRRCGNPSPVNAPASHPTRSSWRRNACG